jgi:hypothetical protein
MDLLQKGEKSDYPSGKRPSNKRFLPLWPSYEVPAIKTLDSLALTW